MGACRSYSYPVQSLKLGRMRRLIPATAASLLLLAGTGCAVDTSGATKVAEDFHRAVNTSDWAAACDLLQPTIRDKSKEKDGDDCQTHLASVHLRDPGEVVKTEGYGREALVQFERDAVFVAVSGSSWRVTAAGCTPREEIPYSCEVGGR
ncbi:hypothetical protein NtRootA1_24280 [Arthrobacter sp. NtRootA1]|nr:hypothetical protein NtRootA1_24280 [Arthrobacter sp. NtRootA1]